MTITIDKDAVEVPDDQLTSHGILRAAGYDPAQHYLIKIKDDGRSRTEYRRDQKVAVNPGEVFASVYTGPTTIA